MVNLVKYPGDGAGRLHHSRTLATMDAPHWDAWSVENLPGLSDSLKVAKMVRWWKASASAKQDETIIVSGYSTAGS